MIAHSGLVSHLSLAALAVSAVVAYFVAWNRAPQARFLRLVSWSGGWVTLIIALSPPMEAAAERSFTGHMVQHLAMMVVAAPLLALSSPVEMFAAALRAPLRRSGAARQQRRFSRGFSRRLHRVGPVAAPLTFVTVLFVTHLTGVYDRALVDRWVHDLEHVAYLGSAVWLWSVILVGRRADAIERVGSVFAVIAGSALLGVVLLSASTPLVDTYAANLGTAEALSDQRAAASLMWVGGMATSLPLLFLAFWRWASTEERVTRRAEQLRDQRGSGGLR